MVLCHRQGVLGTIDTLIDEHPMKSQDNLFLPANPAAKEDAEKQHCMQSEKGLIPVDIETTYDTTKYSRVQAGLYLQSQ
jgi:hypothetical protein